MTTLIEIKDTEDFLTGNVGQTDIPFDWWISAADDLVILVDGNPATFTVAAQYIKNNDGGFAVLDSALSGGEDIAIYRSTEIGRDVIYSNDLRPLTMNNEGAKHIAIMQELKRNSDKKIGYPEGTNVTTPQLPTPSDGKAIVFDGNTGALRASNVNIDDLDTTIADIIALEAAASASATTASNQATAAAGSATDAQSAKTDAEAARDTALASIGTVKATAADTTPKPLNDILAAGQLCFKSVTNPGGDETLAFGVSIADQATAEAGTSDAVAMTPRGTKQAIAALETVSFIENISVTNSAGVSITVPAGTKILKIVIHRAKVYATNCNLCAALYNGGVKVAGKAYGSVGLHYATSAGSDQFLGSDNAPLHRANDFDANAYDIYWGDVQLFTPLSPDTRTKLVFDAGLGIGTTPAQTRVYAMNGAFSWVEDTGDLGTIAYDELRLIGDIANIDLEATVYAYK